MTHFILHEWHDMFYYIFVASVDTFRPVCRSQSLLCSAELPVTLP
jgi:hypothetical protein